MRDGKSWKLINYGKLNELPKTQKNSFSYVFIETILVKEIISKFKRFSH